jgi:hypothetical protein
MTYPEGLASAAATGAPSRPAPVPDASSPSPQSTATSTWREIYAAASPARQRELLRLARSQGVLYSSQIGSLNGNRGRHPAETLLATLLGDHVDELEPVRIYEPLSVFDEALDAAQREAVAKGVLTPDLCLIQGLPGTGKSRVAAEIVMQSVSRGERVLLVSFTAAVLDLGLARVASQDSVFAVRCLAPGEQPELLPPAIRRLTFAERAQFLREQALADAKREMAAAQESRLHGLRQDAVLSRLRDLAQERVQIDRQIAALREAEQQIPADVEAEAAAAAASPSPFATSLAHLFEARREELSKLEKSLSDMEAELARVAHERLPLTHRRQQISPLVEAKKGGCWWTAAWWRAALTRGLVGELADLDRKIEENGQVQERLEHEKQSLQEQCAALEKRFADEKNSRVAAEIAVRRQRSAQRAAALENDGRLLNEKWKGACHELAPQTARPEAATPESVEAAFVAWRRQCERDDERCRLAEEWTSYLRESSGRIEERLAGYVNVLAGTAAALAADTRFGDVGVFDVMIVQEAAQLREPDFLELARRARRWVLVGETLCGAETVDGSAAAASAPHHDLNADFFTRLWKRLHPDPRSLPPRWQQEHERWCCRLRSVPSERRRWLESERVADSPDIELRILAAPAEHPVLAEVVFPPRMSIGQAKQFLARELEELPIESAAARLRWVEEGDRLALRFEDAASPDGDRVLLNSGVTEVLAAPAANGCKRPWHSVRLEFARAAGWDRLGAEHWVHRHLGLLDLGRTAYLDVPYRMHPDLAAFVSDVLFAGGYRLETDRQANGRGAAAANFRCPGGNGCASLVHFLSVPAAAAEPQDRNRPRAAKAAKPRSAKGGAGFELNLADERHRERLPAELRPELPEQGLVNYLEAQAVVRALETVAADAAGPAGAGETRIPVAVVALYPAQAELIRRLVRQSKRLAGSPLDLHIDVPSAFRGREAAITLLSLTRSHAHRAVSFGDDPQGLALALTRARSKLLLVGDPGTLTRRCQWEGPVDHLNAAAAARERTLITRLVEYCQGRGQHQRAFHLCEVNGA